MSEALGRNLTTSQGYGIEYQVTSQQTVRTVSHHLDTTAIEALQQGATERARRVLR